MTSNMLASEQSMNNPTRFKQNSSEAKVQSNESEEGMGYLAGQRPKAG
jgi:hypothetical protein